MKNLMLKIVPVILLVAWVQCQSDKTAMMSSVTGAINEVLLVLDKAKWEDSLGVKYLDILAKEQEALNQPEPVFDVLRIPPAAFTNLFKKHRNIIINKIGPAYDTPRMIIQKDLWAKTQLIITLYAPDDSSAVKLIEKNSATIVSQLNQAERNRLMELNRKNPERGIYTQLMENHDLGLFVPSGYKLDVDSSDFVWISLETMEAMQGVFVYHTGFKALKPITPEFLIAKRNRVLKKYVPGGPPGSYMTTEMLEGPIYTEFIYKDRQYYELKGLWTLEKGFMGGPFISLTTIDDKRNRIVTVEGYVYAPNKDKKNFIRQLEAIVYSLELKE